MSETTITVSTPAQLVQALKTATGGETILLAGGNYGDLALTKTSDIDCRFPSNVTIASADPANPATFTGLDVREAANLSFDGLLFDYTYVPGQSLQARPFIISDSSNVAIRNSVFDGDLAQGLSVLDDGFAAGIGMSFRACTGAVFENNEVFGFWRGFTSGESKDIAVLGNDIHSIRLDGMIFSQVQGVRIEDNFIHDFDRNLAAGDHADMIQFWTQGNDQPSTDIVIRGNFLDIGTGDRTQSIFMRNEEVDSGRAGSEMYYRNVLIEGNTIVNDHVHGITVGETHGLTIRNNSVLHGDNGAYDGMGVPQINLSPDSIGVLVARNAVAKITGHSGQEEWILIGNAFVQNQDPKAPGYYGNEFITSTLQLTGGSHDFRAVSGGMLDRLGAGSAATRESPDELDAQFQVRRCDSGCSTARVFDASAAVNGTSPFPEGTIFAWSFGDGTTAFGKVVSHSFTGPGVYDVRLKVSLPGGHSDMVALPLAVSDNRLISMGSDTGFLAYEAGTPLALATKSLPGVLELGGSGTAAAVDQKLLDPIFVNQSFDIDLRLQADQAGNTGEIFRVHGSFIASVIAGGEVQFRLSTTGGEMRLQTSGAGVTDTDLHDIGISFVDGRLSIWVDGIERAATVVSGGILDTDRDLIFGTNWASNFDGTLHAFSMFAGGAAPDLPVTEVIDTRYGMPGAEMEVLRMTLGEGRFTAFDHGTPVALATHSTISDTGLRLGEGFSAGVAHRHVVDVIGAEGVRIDFTLEADNADSYGALFRLPGTILARVTQGGELRFRIFDPEGDVVVQTKNARLDDGQPHKLSVVIDDGTLSVLVDGTVRAEAAAPESLTGVGTSDLLFGHGLNHVFAGNLTAFGISVEAVDTTSALAHLQDSFSFLIDPPGLLPSI